MRRALLLSVLALLGACALVVAGCGGEDEVSPTAETVIGGEGDTGGDTGGGDTGEDETDTGGTTDTAGETTDTGEDEGGGEGEGDAEAGAEVYTAQGCGGCHTLEAAGSSGSVGPNLDESQPDLALAIDRVTNGQGAMPAFSDSLNEQEIADVATYVVESTS